MQWIVNLWREWKLNRQVKRFRKRIIEEVQFYYRMGHGTDEIVQTIRSKILVNNDESNPDVAKLLRNLTGLVEAHHHVHPKPFKAVP